MSRRADRARIDNGSVSDGPFAAVSSNKHAIPMRVGNFRLVKEHQVSFAPIQVAKWRSDVSGLSVVWASSSGEIGLSVQSSSDFVD